jgi:hypothetical protein
MNKPACATDDVTSRPEPVLTREDLRRALRQAEQREEQARERTVRARQFLDAAELAEDDARAEVQIVRGRLEDAT